jgi:nucleoside-diphosphate-sugar epimerase
MFHQAYDWPITCLRPFNAYGPWQTPDRIIPELILKALRGEDFDMTDGRQTREFNYVEDLASAFVLAATAPGIDGEVINVGCGEEVSIRDVVVKVLALMGDPVKPRIGALEHRPTEIWRMYCDNTKARERLGWSPEFSLDRGLEATIEWFTSGFRSGSPFLAGSYQGG